MCLHAQGRVGRRSLLEFRRAEEWLSSSTPYYSISWTLSSTTVGRQLLVALCVAAWIYCLLNVYAPNDHAERVES